MKLRIIVFAAIAISAITFFSACSSNRSASSATSSKLSAVLPPIPGITAENYPVVDGSTSNRHLIELLACRVVGLKGELKRSLGSHWAESSVVVVPIDTDPAKTEAYNKATFARRTRGTHDAYLNLLNETAASVRVFEFNPLNHPAGLIVVARAPSDDELAEAKKKGETYDVRPVALDAFIFIVNTANPVKSLTLNQVRDIYTARTNNWKAIGGTDKEILAFIRERNSGSQELMEKLVMKGETITAKEDRMLITMTAPVERVSKTTNAIAYSVFYYEEIMSPSPNNELVAINGVMPTRETIANRKYPLTAEVYVVTLKSLNPNSPAAKLRDWLLSDDGQRLVAESGYVPIRPVK